MANKKKRTKPKRTVFRKIINTFIGIFGFLVFIVLLVLVLSQTSTFRNYLKNRIIETYSNSLNGNLKIDDIKGSLLTNIRLKDVSLSDSTGMIFNASSIKVNLNPFNIFNRKLEISSIELDSMKIELKEISPGVLNISTLAKVDSVQKESTALESDETAGSSTLPFDILTAKMKITNSEFIYKDFSHLTSDSTYGKFNYNDIKLDILQTEIISEINFKSGVYQVGIENTSIGTNVEGLTIKNFSSGLLLAKDKALINELTLITERSKININAELDSVNFLSGVEYQQFGNLPVQLELNADPFNFDDLSTFVESTDILKGSPKVKLIAGGVYGKLKVEDLNITLNETKLNANGYVFNLHEPQKLLLDININDSQINESDAVRLLPSIGIPDYDEFSLNNLNIKFKGEPTKFYTSLSGLHDNGKINVAGNLDFSQEIMNYDLTVKTNNLDLHKILGTKSNVNVDAKIKGKGVDPKILSANLDVNLWDSEIGTFDIDTVSLSSNAKSKKIDIDVYSIFNNTEGEIRGSIDFTNNNVPSYSLSGNLNGLNLNDFLEEEQFETELNFSFVAAGFDLEPDNMTGNFFVEMRESKFANKDIKDSKLSLFLIKENNYRSIKLNSDFVDLNFEGEYKLSSAINVVTGQVKELSEIIGNKLYELNPANIGKNDIPYPNIETSPTTLEDLDVDFSFQFKDFDLIALLLDSKEFDIQGSGNGRISNDSNTFTISTEMNLDYLLNGNRTNPLFLSNINTDIHFTRNNSSVIFDDLFGSVSISGDKVIINKELHDVAADIAFNGSTILFNTNFTYDNILSAYTDGEIVVTNEGELFTLYELNVNYNKVNFSNLDEIKFRIFNNNFYVNDFSLFSDKGKLSLSGEMNENGELNFDLGINDFTGSKLAQIILAQNDKKLRSLLNLESKITGNLNSPVINTKIAIDSVGYDESIFGRFSGNIISQDGNANLNITFNNYESTEDTLLYFTGVIPYSESNEEVSKYGSAAHFHLFTNGFNLAILGNIIPYTKGLKGVLTADVTAKGNADKLNYSGKLSLHKGFFLYSDNNIGYEYSANLSFNDDNIQIDKVILASTVNTPYHQSISATGNVKLEGITPKEVYVTANGNLAVLSQATKFVNPNFYGDLTLSSDGNWDYIYKDGKSVFTGNIKLTNADLIISPSGQTEVTSLDKINYLIIGDTSSVDLEEIKFRNLVKSDSTENNVTIDRANFDYNFNVIIEKEAKLQFLLSKVWNQKLSVLTKGNLKYESIDGVPRAQGSLELQSGSKLEFVKSFDATGNIKFESDITNPYLDVTATYTGSYNQGTDDLPDIVDVQVEMKLNGTLDKLGTNLMQNPENIAIYMGSRNIENKSRETRYDISDAILFIYIGRFKEDLTANDKNKLAGLGNTATSFLGSALTSIINSAVGDVVSDIQVDQSGLDTKIMISGRYQNIRYSVGGTTRIQNISEANLKIEYLLLPNLLLRLERKDPVVESFGIDEKISELGLKYRIQF